EAPARPAKRKRRRVFRKGTADTASDGGDRAEPGAGLRHGSDELDLGWGDPPSGSGVGDRWLEEQRPPHYE
ncbi:MAG: hypothetical protein HOV97_07215, partial [Nonomuraea sp.]|nr:hypothetical protein [Nonomuraea sp.]